MRIFKSVCLFFLLLVSFVAYAETPEEKGLNIAMAADRRDAGFKDFTADMLMVLKNQYGEESSRNIHISIFEGDEDGDKSLTVFDSPADVKGTALLTFTHKTGSDDQWLYLHALKRVKRISAANKSGSFMGSEFAYEDISSQEVEKYRYRWVRDEKYDGEDCFVLERYPVDPNSGYTKQVVWLDKAEYRVLKVDFFDRKNSLLKSLTNRGYRQYLGKHWRVDESHMLNHQTGKRTLLSWKNYRFRSGLKDSDFNENALKRAR